MSNNGRTGGGIARGGSLNNNTTSTSDTSSPLPSPASSRTPLPASTLTYEDRSSTTTTQGGNRWILASSSINGGNSQSQQQQPSQPSHFPSSSARSSRRYESQRPGTASTVSSYTSARPYLDDNSPIRRTFALPSIDSVSSNQPQQTAYANEGSSPGPQGSFSPNTGTAHMLLHGGASVYTLPIGSSGGGTSSVNRDVSGDARRQNSLGKRQIMASAATAYGPRSDGGAEREEDEVLSISSSRKTIPVYDDALIASVLGPSSPRKSDATSPSRRSTTEARRNSGAINSPKKEAAAASVPVHPHHRKRNDDGSSSKLSEAGTETSLMEKSLPTLSPPRNLNRSLPATPSASTEAVKAISYTPTAKAVHPLPSSDLEPGNASVDTTYIDKGPAGSGALRDRIKKTGGFFRRLGGGGMSSSSSTSSNANGTDGQTGASKSSKLGFSTSRKPLSRKSSSASIATDSRGDLGAWTREDGVPVPDVPEQFREENEARVKTLGKWQKHDDEGGDGDLRYHAPISTKGQGVTASTPTGMDRTLRAWEKEMDAALETSGQDLAEKTKIEPPKPNWTPSPQLPEYRVLNRKGSFMDEGARATAAHDDGSDDSDAEGGVASRYSTVKSYLAPSTIRTGGNTGRAALSDAFGIGVSGSTITDGKVERSHFLSPDRQIPSAPSTNAMASARSVSSPVTLPPPSTSTTTTKIIDRKPSRTFSSSTSPAMSSTTTGTMTEPVPSLSRFIDTKQQFVSSYDEIESFRRARQDNGSSATARSFETAVDKPAYLGKQSSSTDEGRPSTGSRKIGVVNRPSPFASRGDLNSGLDTSVDVPTDRAVDLSEPSIRLVSGARTFSEEASASDKAASEDFKMPLSPANEAAACAERCWNEDETFKKRERIAEWLGGHKDLNGLACKLYFDKFDFKGTSVDQAFRRLCDKLYLRAETQQLDRILAIFSQRYYECNRQTQFRNADVIHAVTFSILLLNTDLHVAELSDRMTRAQFVRNTIDAIVESNAVPKEDTSEASQSWEVRLESALREIYNSVKSERIRLPMSDSASLASQKGGTTIRAAGSERFANLKRGSIRGIQGLMGSSNAAGVGEGDAISAISAFGSGGRGASRSSIGGERPSRSSVSSMPPPTLQVIPTIGFASTLSKSIIRETHDEEGGDGILSTSTTGRLDSSTSTESSNDDISDEELALMGAPWAKEGMLTRKQYWEAPQKRAKDKSWIECFVVIQKGQFSMFRFGSGSSGTIKQSSASLVGGGNWLQNATCIGQFSLAHSLANILPPPGYNRNRPHVFALSLSNGSVYFFQTAHEELAQEWTSTCNYWAARMSKEPLAAGVSNMEYGWNRVQSLSASSSANDAIEQYNGRVPNDVEVRGSGAQSVADSIDVPYEEQIADAASPSTSQVHLTNYSAIGSGYASKNSAAAADTRSIRSGRSSKSGRMRSAMSQALFQNWSGGAGSGGHSLDRTTSSGALGQQSGVSSPVASLISLSTPNTSVITLDRPLIVHEWRVPAPPSMASPLSEEEQLEACLRHTLRIENDLTEHNGLRQPMLMFFKALSSSSTTSSAARFGSNGGQSGAASSSLSLSPKPKNVSAISLPSPGSNAAGKRGTSSSQSSATMANRAMANWERKSAYLLAELTKYQVYIDSLRSANRLRAEKRDERQLSRMMRLADEDLSAV